MHGFDRTDRVSHLIQREIAHILTFEMKDERLSLVSVTGVELSRDFKSARVFVSALGEPERIKGVLEALASSAHFIRSRLRERISIKNIPMLTFLHDPSIIEGIKINALLSGLKTDES
jgi:ribosome-binding factor A